MSGLQIFSVVIVCLGLGGAGRAAAQDRDVGIAAWTGDLPIEAPWLRDRVPGGVVSYVRIPHPLGLLGIPKGNGLDDALGSEANIRNLISIQQGLGERLSAEVPSARFLAALRSPIELVVLSAPGPSAVIAATLGLRSNAELEAFIAELGTAMPGIGLSGPLDDDGFGQIVGAPIPVYLYFDASSGRFALYGGLVADPTSFVALIEGPAGDTAGTMAALERQVDERGHGFFAWVDGARARQFAAMFDPEAVQELQAAGLDRLDALALGAGVADGKGRLRLVADLADDMTTRPVPVVSNDIAATSVGDPRSLGLLSIPSADEFARLEALILSSASTEAVAQWDSVKAEFTARMGSSIEDILRAVGPELLVTADGAGDWLGLRVRDNKRVEGILERWSEAAGVDFDTREVAGVAIREAELPASLGLPVASGIADAPLALRLMSQVRRRIYWIADGDYLYLASTPQVLIDRIALGAERSIADWLDDTQRIDVSSSLLAASGSVRNLPQRLYAGYIGTMQALADLVGVEFDIWSMPTAAELALPEQGTLGFTLNLGQPYVSLELSYESHPAEVFLGGSGMAGAAAIGIAAAIAIPAYQDYTIRAQVSEGLNFAASAKAAVAETYLASGTVPADRVAAGMSPAATDSAGAYVESIDIVGGQIRIRYGNSARPEIAGQTVALTPYRTGDGGIVWVCGYASGGDAAAAIGTMEPYTTIMPQYLPSGCR